MDTSHIHLLARRWETNQQGAGGRTGTRWAGVAVTKLTGLISVLCLFAPSAASASTQAPAVAAPAFAYRLSHAVTPLPDAVFQTVTPPDAVPYAFDAADTNEHPPPQLTLRLRLGPARDMSRSAACAAIVSVARGHDLPIVFFANLIWQESNFNPRDISRAGAQGIAQFMPETAVEFDLINPFEPIHALNVAARFLRVLHARFGNLGLAAAAYNAGPGRITNWLTKGTSLPNETRNYVLRITGKPASTWTGADVKSDPEVMLMPAKAPCPEVEEAAREQAKAVQVAKLIQSLARATEPPPPGADKPAEVVAGIADAKTEGRGHRMLVHLAKRDSRADEDKPRGSRKRLIANRGKDADDDEPRALRHLAKNGRDADEDKPRASHERLAKPGKDADDDDRKSRKRLAGHRKDLDDDERRSSRRHALHQDRDEPERKIRHASRHVWTRHAWNRRERFASR